MPTNTPTPETTLAILLGASQWPDYRTLVGDDKEWTPFARSAEDVYDYITSPEFLAIPTRNVNRDLFDADVDPGTMLKDITDFIERRSDELERDGRAVSDLIVYYIGHGGFANKDNDFYLAIRSTSESAPFVTGLPIEQLAQAILKPARFVRRYIILDCCFAARAFEAFQSDPGSVAAVIADSSFPRGESVAEDEGLPSTGTALLCASSAERPARVDRSLSHTMFTWGLLNTLKQGEAAAPRKLSVQDLCNLISRRIRKAFPDKQVHPEIHMPDQRQGSVAEVPLFPNVGWARGRPPAEPDEPRTIDLPQPPPDPPAAGSEARPRPGAEPLRTWAVCERIDRFICEKSPLTVLGLAVILGGMVLVLASPVGADIVQIHKSSAPSGWTCGSGKNVGMWRAPNWLLVYLLLFPIFLSQISALARHVRKVIDESVGTNAIIDEYGRTVRKAEVHGALRAELRANNGVFAMLCVAVCVLALIGWGTTVGAPIWRYHVDREVVDWATAAAACGTPGLREPTLIFTLIAYLWMGLSLFAYFACLFLGVIYASFLHRLAAGSETDSDEGPPGRLLFRRKMIVEHLRGFFTPYFVACVFGFLAAYCMRLQADYVGAPHTNVISYWLDDVRRSFGDLGGLIVTPPADAAGIQRDEVSNQTQLTASFVMIVTMVALLATLWQLGGTFRDAKEYLLTRLETKRNSLRVFRDYAPEEVRSIAKTGFLASVVPNLWPFAILTAGIALATVMGLRSLTFALTAILAGGAWIAVAFVRRRSDPAGDG